MGIAHMGTTREGIDDTFFEDVGVYTAATQGLVPYKTLWKKVAVPRSTWVQFS